VAKPGVHMHGCPSCLDTFICACKEAATSDPKCSRCIGGHKRTAIHMGRLPIACCYIDTRLARRDEISTYRLAGTRTWFMCACCKRAFIYQPKESE
jgi:hypothetical protein